MSIPIPFPNIETVAVPYLGPTRNPFCGTWFEFLLCSGIVAISAIHKAAGSLVTGHSQKRLWQERPPLMALGMERWNDGIVPVK